MKEKLLVSGDFVTFEKGTANGEFYIGFRRRPVQGFSMMTNENEEQPWQKRGANSLAGNVSKKAKVN